MHPPTPKRRIVTLERRFSPRYRVGAEVRPIRFRLLSAQAAGAAKRSAMLINHSNEGLAMRVTQRLWPRQVLKLSLPVIGHETVAPTLGEVCWMLPERTGRACLIGIRYLL